MAYSKLRYKDLLIALTIERNTIQSLFGSNKTYNSLVAKLIKYDDETPFPLQKDLANDLGISKGKMMRLMRDLYSDFKKAIRENGGYQIKNTEVRITAETYFKKYWVISPDQLRYIPSRGDYFILPFIKDGSNINYFKVKEIYHEIENQTHYIDIDVTVHFDRPD